MVVFVLWVVGRKMEVIMVAFSFPFHVPWVSERGKLERKRRRLCI